MGDEVLFNRREMYSVVRAQAQAVNQRIDAIPVNTLLNASEHDLILSLVDDCRLNIPMLKDEEIYIAEFGETKVDVRHDPMRLIHDRSRPFNIPGNRTVIAVPFEGDPSFFEVQPHAYTSHPPVGQIVENEILLTYVRTDQNADAVKQEYTQTVTSIKEYLEWLRESATPFNNQLTDLVTQRVRQRKERLLADAGMVAALGLPMKKRNGVPTTYAVPIARRTPRIEDIKVLGAFAPEPALALEEYDEIIGIMCSMVRVVELSPHEFSEIGEEVLRSHFLVQLNGQYKGQATGETFNYQGKTDILIRVNDKNVFIGECKFWNGEKAYLETISQLLSYLSWRDTKVAVLVFNRNADFSAVLTKIKETTPTHPHYKRHVKDIDETTFRYVFSQPGDVNREMIVTVLVFDMPKNPLDQKAISAGHKKPDA